MRFASAAFSCARALLAVLIAGLARPAVALDVFNTSADIPATPAASMLGGQACAPARLPAPLPLDVAVAQAFCNNPKTRSAWADVKAAADALGISQATWLPTVQATAQRIGDHSLTTVADYSVLKTEHDSSVETNTLALNWVLYDFGNRSASVDNSRFLLAAAHASENEALQKLLADTAKDYFDASAAHARRDANQRLRDYAQGSLEAASARVDKGVAPITDKLQAQTAYAQAVYSLTKAEGDYQTALGALAIDISGSPETALVLPADDSAALPGTGFVTTTHELLGQALNAAPAVVAARAQAQAARAKVDAIRAQGYASLNLIGQASWNNQPVSVSLGQPELSARSRDAYLGLKLQIPLFEGFGREYRVRQAEAQAESAQEQLHGAEQQAAADVWSSYQTLKTSSENLVNTDTVLQSARAAFEASQHRYQSGVGNILELLDAQRALATAEQQRIQARSDWQTARIQLAVSVGAAGLWVLEEGGH